MELGAESAAPGARIVLECKQANYTLAKALEEIEVPARRQGERPPTIDLCSGPRLPRAKSCPFSRRCALP